MKRFFNTAGPVRFKKNYCIDPLSRVDLDEIQLIIRQEKNFILHAPRQTGKGRIKLYILILKVHKLPVKMLNESSFQR